jgi:hypothetical protein
VAKFQHGNPGKPKGAKNRATITVKQAFADAFEALQDDPKAKLEVWGKENPTEFYKLASKLIPMQVSGDAENPLEVKHDLSGLATDELAALANAIVKLNVTG